MAYVRLPLELKVFAPDKVSPSEIFFVDGELFPYELGYGAPPAHLTFSNIPLSKPLFSHSHNLACTFFLSTPYGTYLCRVSLERHPTERTIVFATLQWCVLKGRDNFSVVQSETIASDLGFKVDYLQCTGFSVYRLEKLVFVHFHGTPFAVCFKPTMSFGDIGLKVLNWSFKVSEAWRDYRLFFGNAQSPEPMPNMVAWTDAYSADISETNFVLLPDEADGIVSLHHQEDRLIVVREKSIWSLYPTGNYLAPYEPSFVVSLPSPPMSNYSADVIGDVLMVRCHDGVYVFRGNMLENVSAGFVERVTKDKPYVCAVRNLNAFFLYGVNDDEVFVYRPDLNLWGKVKLEVEFVGMKPIQFFHAYNIPIGEIDQRAVDLPVPMSYFLNKLTNYSSFLDLTVNLGDDTFIRPPETAIAVPLTNDRLAVFISTVMKKKGWAKTNTLVLPSVVDSQYFRVYKVASKLGLISNADGSAAIKVSASHKGKSEVERRFDIADAKETLYIEDNADGFAADRFSVEVEWFVNSPYTVREVELWGVPIGKRPFISSR